MNKNIFYSTLLFLFTLILIFFIFDGSREFLLAFLVRILIFVKKNIFKMLTAFFLVKGKFILSLFMKKIAILSTIGLSKRYMIEKVIIKNFKVHFLIHLKDDIKLLLEYATKNFYSFSIVKKIVTLFIFLGSLGFIGKFMGGVLAFKVFVAKIWSFLLAIFLKVSSTVIYFFTDYLWGSWLEPIVEIIIFTWLLSLLERVPFFYKIIQKIYSFTILWFEWFEYYMDIIFHIPLKRFLKYLVGKIKESIYRFIGYKKVSKWHKLQEYRKQNPNFFNKLYKTREYRKKKRGSYLSSYEKLQLKRKA